jgi:hypothetical protein
MSIKSYVSELESIQIEMKVLTAKKKKLTQQKKQLEKKIAEYLKSKEQAGVKYQGTAIILEQKEKPSAKKQKQKNLDAIAVLTKYGISNPNKVLEEMLNARKGETKVEQIIKIKKYKEQK